MLFKRKLKTKPAVKDPRLTLLTLVLLIFGGLIIFRLFNLQVLNYEFYSALASGQHEVYQQLFPKRGKIFVRAKGELYPLATNRDLYLLYTVPSEVKNPHWAAKKLSQVLTIDEADLVAKLTKVDDPYEPLKNRLNNDKVEEIKALNIEGLYLIPESWRYYPEKNVASHILGFVGFQGDSRVGRYGLEGYFEELLAGKSGSLKLEKDAQGRWITITKKESRKALDGADLVLTIDRTIQSFVCDSLSDAVQRHGADGGTVVIINPKTGAIISLCNYPDFDPNEYSLAEHTEIFNNSAIFYQYEPGSIFKPITIAAAIDTEKITPTTTYEDKGFVQVGKHIIRNVENKKYGQPDMTEVLKESINTGAIFAGQQLEEGIFREYVKKFGFGQLTEIELNTEVMGDVSPLDKKGKIYNITASFGQGITVTPIQMVVAYAAIANQGKLMRPYIVDEIIGSDGTKTKTKTELVREVISPSTATLLSGMLVSVVKDGHAKRAGAPGYYIAGKTGTAEVPDPKKGGYGEKTIHSFVGFGPVDDPKFAMIVKLDDPKSVRFSASSAAPLFGQISSFMLKYYQIPPGELLTK